MPFRPVFVPLLLLVGAATSSPSSAQTPPAEAPGGALRGSYGRSPYVGTAAPGSGTTCAVGPTACLLRRQAPLGSSCRCGATPGYVSF